MIRPSFQIPATRQVTLDRILFLENATNAYVELPYNQGTQDQRLQDRTRHANNIAELSLKSATHANNLRDADICTSTGSKILLFVEEIISHTALDAFKKVLQDATISAANKPKSILQTMRTRLYTRGTAAGIASRIQTEIAALPMFTSTKDVTTHVEDVSRGIAIIAEVKKETEEFYNPQTEQCRNEIERLTNVIKDHMEGPPINPHLDPPAPVFVPDPIAAGIAAAQRNTVAEQLRDIQMRQSIDTIPDYPERNFAIKLLSKFPINTNDQNMNKLRNKVDALVHDPQMLHPWATYDMEIQTIIGQQALLSHLTPAQPQQYSSMDAYLAHAQQAHEPNIEEAMAAGQVYSQKPGNRYNSQVLPCFNIAIDGTCPDLDCIYNHNVKPRTNPEFKGLTKINKIQSGQIEQLQREINELKKRKYDTTDRERRHSNDRRSNSRDRSHDRNDSRNSSDKRNDPISFIERNDTRGRSGKRSNSPASQRLRRSNSRDRNSGSEDFR